MDMGGLVYAVSESASQTVTVTVPVYISDTLTVSRWLVVFTLCSLAGVFLVFVGELLSIAVGTIEKYQEVFFTLVIFV